MLDLLCLNPKSHFKNDWCGQAVVVLDLNPSPLKEEEMDFSGLQVSLVYNLRQTDVVKLSITTLGIQKLVTKFAASMAT